jgi:hypothetical protein
MMGGSKLSRLAPESAGGGGQVPSLHIPAVHWHMTLQVSVREPLQLPQAVLRVVLGVQTP